VHALGKWVGNWQIIAARANSTRTQNGTDVKMI